MPMDIKLIGLSMALRAIGVKSSNEYCSSEYRREDLGTQIRGQEFSD